MRPSPRNWIDANDKRVRNDSDDLSQWWRVFNDPVLDSLINDAYRQNLTLREAGFRVLAARAQLGIAIGNLFPQQQYASGGYTTTLTPRRLTTSCRSATLSGFPSSGTSTSGITVSASAGSSTSGAVSAGPSKRTKPTSRIVADYDDVLVTLLGDVASNYVQYRTLEQQIAYAKYNVDLQRQTLTIVEARFRAGTTGELDVHQSRSTLAQTEAGIPELEISLRQAANQLCILMGIPPEDLQARLGTAAIPTTPTDLAVAFPPISCPPARHPPAERNAAAQSAQIGIAEADFYPAISIVGTVGYSAEAFPICSARPRSTAPSAPASTGRSSTTAASSTTSASNRPGSRSWSPPTSKPCQCRSEAENGWSRSSAETRTQFQSESVDRAQKAVTLGLVQYQAGTVDFTRITQLEQNLVLQQNTLAAPAAKCAGPDPDLPRLGRWLGEPPGARRGSERVQEVVLTNVVPATPPAPAPPAQAPLAQPQTAPVPPAAPPAKIPAGPAVPNPGR